MIDRNPLLRLMCVVMVCAAGGCDREPSRQTPPTAPARPVSRAQPAPPLTDAEKQALVRAKLVIEMLRAGGRPTDTTNAQPTPKPGNPAERKPS